MSQIVLLYWRICIFVSGPDAVPASRTLLGATIVVNALLSIAMYMWVNEPDFLTAATLVTVSMAGTGGLVWVIMQLMDLRHRLPQTLTALYGVDIITTALTGLIAVFTNVDEPGLTATGVSMVSLLMLWNLAIVAFIFHRALNIHLGFGMLVALFVLIFSIAMSQAAIST
ncbi:MAG: hypothetical protein AAF993_11945 [Pseudomonadota bacterium]